MALSSLRVWDFRCYEQAEMDLSPAITVIEGANGEGKTSLVEAVSWLATGRSFRGVPDAALVRAGAESAMLRVDVVDGDRRRVVDGRISTGPRGTERRVDQRRVTFARQGRDALRVTVFAPDDLELVKHGPAGRRDYLDDLLEEVAPRYRAVRADYARVVRQRNAVLRSRRDPDTVSTLVVFDDQLVRHGTELLRGRLGLIERLVPEVDRAYRDLAGQEETVDARYEAEWNGGTTPEADALAATLRDALSDRRRAELDRGVTLIGPHRDEWRLQVSGLDSRTHASQGEQRTLALALRLGAHRLVADAVGMTPVLLLDDVFSELDADRSSALLAHLGAGQTLVTTTSCASLPLHASRVLRVDRGRVAVAA
jgi:DNA replication and repair protein RecF